MKKLLFAATLLVAIASSSFAAGTAANTKAARSFNADFKDAKNVNWKTGEGYIKASFVWNEMNMESFYNEEGELIGSSRAIDINALPVKALKVIKEKYDGYVTHEVVEFDSVEDGICYYVSEVKENTKTILKISSTGDVSVYSKK